MFQSQEVSSTASCLQSQEVTYTELSHGGGGGSRRGYAQMTMTPSPSSSVVVPAATSEMMSLQHTHSMQRREGLVTIIRMREYCKVDKCIVEGHTLGKT